MKNKTLLGIVAVGCWGLLPISESFAAPAPKPPSKVCIASNGTLTLRVKCTKSETTATLASFQSVGTTGAQGSVGPQGPQGVQGTQGLKGDKGDQGIQGVVGSQGLKGDTGSQGAKGDTGEQGPKGEDGTSALDTLPSGRTVRGYIDQSIWINTTDTNFRGYVSGQLPIPAPEIYSVLIATTPALTSACNNGLDCTQPDISDAIQEGLTKCTGTADLPQAALGVLCFYPKHISGRILERPTSTIYGFSFYIFSKAETGNARSLGIEGTFAYTAP